MPSHPLREIYRQLFDFFGHQHWWPGETPFEVLVGAVLTQNTGWANVELAISNLKNHGMLSFDLLEALPAEELARQIRPCGYYNLKARRLKNLLAHISSQFNGDLELFFGEEPQDLRESLLQVKGIGPETADSIILYAANKPTFVVDAYTQRILFRHGLLAEDATDYHHIQELFLAVLPEDVAMFNEYHALLVRTGKEYCKKKKPRCQECPLEGF